MLQSSGASRRGARALRHPVRLQADRRRGRARAGPRPHRRSLRVGRRADLAGQAPWAPGGRCGGGVAQRSRLQSALAAGFGADGARSGPFPLAASPRAATGRAARGTLVTQVALVSSEAIRPSMGGIGVRYLEFARRLPAAGFEVRLLSPGLPEAAAACGLDGVVVDTLRRGALAAQLADCDVVIAQGQHANDVLVEMPRLPAVIDLYDPWLVENLHYAAELGLDPYRNDHATWWLQLSRGDYFLCSSAEQRLYYLGFLTALGRVHPELLAADPEAAGLIGIVPFGIDLHAGGQSPLLPERRPGERRLLFGGLYDWYDPWVVLAALERLDDPDVVLL